VGIIIELIIIAIDCMGLKLRVLTRAKRVSILFLSA